MAINSAPILCAYDDTNPADSFGRESFIHGTWEPWCAEHREHFTASPHATYQIAYINDHNPTRIRGAEPNQHDPPGQPDSDHDVIAIIYTHVNTAFPDPAP
jgi:hypothetical protein